MEEIWKPVRNYEELYKVSNLGRVYRIGAHVKRLNHLMYVPVRMMGSLDNGKGYLRIKLTKENKSKRIMLHRIIAEAFIPNPQNKRCVNHLDGNKKNNCIENLEWCTHSENVNHSIKIGTFHMSHPNKRINKTL